jgi:hypothetical protein
MFARGLVSSHPARFLASRENPLSPIIPALARLSRKSNYSRTYGIPRGGGYTGSFVRPIRHAHLTETPLCALFCFTDLRTLSFFGSHLSAAFLGIYALFPEKPGVGTPPVQPIPQTKSPPHLRCSGARAHATDHVSITSHESPITSHNAYFDSVCCTVPTRQKFCPVSGSV